MITPNKVISFEESALAHVGLVMRQGPHPRDVHTLFHEIGRSFESIDQFLLTLDVLFVLGRVDVDPIERTISYAR